MSIMLFKRIYSTIVLLVVVFSCNQKNDVIIQNEKAVDTKIKSIRIDTTFATKNNKIESKVDNQEKTKNIVKDTYNSYPETLTKLEDKYYKIDLGSFDCAEISQFYNYLGKLDTKGLFEIDSITGKELFGDNNSESYGSFSGSYLYSLEQPILSFYPITVIQWFGVVERPMMLVLFDKNGKYVNAIEVADAYGEEGGCLNSYFVNDSTLIRKYEWDNFDENYEDIVSTEVSTERVVIHKDGSFSVYKDEHIKKSKDLIKINNPNLYNVKLQRYNKQQSESYEFDTIVSMEYFTKKSISNIQFNYPTIENRRQLKNTSPKDLMFLELYNDSISIRIKEIKYNHSKHKYSEAVDSLGGGYIMVDGKQAYGLDYGAKEESLSSEIEFIEIIKKSKKVRIPKKYYSNWFNAHLGLDKKNPQLYLLPNNRMIFTLWGSDAAGFYQTILFIKDNKVIKEFEMNGEW